MDWRPLQEHVHCQPKSELDELKQRLVIMWTDMKQCVINMSFEQRWKKVVSLEPK